MRKALTDDQIHEAAHLVGLGLSYWETIKFMRLRCSIATLSRWVHAGRLEALKDAKNEIRKGLAFGIETSQGIYQQACR